MVVQDDWIFDLDTGDQNAPGITVTGTSGVDGLFGTDGDDTIIGLGGADALYGGLGADTFVYTRAADSNAAGYDNLYDFGVGADRIDLTALTVSAVSIIRQNGGSFLFANTTDGPMRLIASGRIIQGSDLMFDENVGVYIQNQGNGAVLVGSANNDVIQGGFYQDTYIGGRGADALIGNYGRDTFAYTDALDSTLTSFDTIFGFRTGVDHIDLTAVGGHNFGIVYEGSRINLFAQSSTGAQMMIRVDDPYGSTTSWWLYTHLSGVDIRGSAAQGVTMIGDGVHSLYGSDGADHIYGGAALVSGSTTQYLTEVITGAGGGDVISLGGGVNRLNYLSVYDSKLNDPDTIFGFVSGRDKVWIAGSNWSYGIAYDGRNSFLYVDIGDDAQWDMMIRFDNVFLRSVDLFNELVVSQVESVSKVFAPETSPLDDGLVTAPMLVSQVGDIAGHHPDWLL